jgi:hypothetical protein
MQSLVTLINSVFVYMLTSKLDLCLIQKTSVYLFKLNYRTNK